MDTGAFSFSCPGCGRRFAWRDELARRAVTCACGRIFKPTAPPTSNAAADRPIDLGDELDGGRGESTGKNIAAEDAGAPGPDLHRPGAVSLGAGMDRARGGGGYELVQEYRPADSSDETAPAAPAMVGFPIRRPRRMTQEEQKRRSGWLSQVPYAPIIIGLAGGCGWVALGAIEASRGELTLGRAVLLASIALISVGLTIGGAWISATVLSFSLGDVREAGIKLSAVAIFASAAGVWMARIDTTSVRGPIMGWNVTIIALWVLFYALFELDLQEILMAVGIIALLHAGAICVIGAA